MPLCEIVASFCPRQAVKCFSCSLTPCPAPRRVSSLLFTGLSTVAKGWRPEWGPVLSWTRPRATGTSFLGLCRAENSRKDSSAEENRRGRKWALEHPRCASHCSRPTLATGPFRPELLSRDTPPLPSALLILNLRKDLPRRPIFEGSCPFAGPSFVFPGKGELECGFTEAFLDFAGILDPVLHQNIVFA